MPLEHVADDNKLRELILLVAQTSEGDAPFGATKLNKLLFYIDFLAYVHLGAPVTGQEYIRLQNGPVPKRLIPISKSMASRGESAFAEREYFGRSLRRTVALRKPDLSMFSAAEVDLVHNLIQKCWGKTAREMSELSHRFAGWKLAKEKETIPYSVALIHRGQRNIKAARFGATLGDKARECLRRASNTG